MARGGFAIAILAAVIAALLFVSAAQSLAKKLPGNGPAAGNFVTLLDGKSEATRKGFGGGEGRARRAASYGQMINRTDHGEGL